MRYLCTLLAAMLLFAAACDGGDDEGDATTTPTTTAIEATPTRTATPSPTPTATPSAEACADRRQLTEDERQPSSDPGRTQGTVVEIDAGEGVIYLEPEYGAVSQVRFTGETAFLFSDGREASMDDLECGGEIAATGTHELRGSIVAGVVGIIVPRPEAGEPSVCPIGDGCSYASQLARYVLSSDGGGVLADADSTAYECPGPNSEGAGGPYPLCNGAPPGETRLGYPFLTTFQGEGGVVSGPDANRIISEWAARADPSLSDAYGDGAPRAYTIACSGVRLDEGSECSDEFTLIFSGLTPGTASGESLGRWMLAIYVHRGDGGEHQAYRFASGLLTYTDLSYPLLGGTGLTFDQDVPAIFAPSIEGDPIVTFFPWKPLEAPQ